MSASNPQGLKIISLILKVLAAFPLLIALGLFAGASYTANRQYNIIEKWPTVDAEVARSELTHHQHQFSHDASSTTVYEALIDFRYTVDGKQYTSPTGRAYSTSDYAGMKGKVDAYAPGTHHPIRYNPSNPNEIRSDAGFTFGFFLAPFILAVAALMTAGGAAVLFIMGTFVGRGMVACSSCGTMMRATRTICPRCGAPLTPGIS